MNTENTTNTPNPYGANPNSKTPDYQQSKNNGLAIAALILGILSIFFYFFTAIPGIITGHMARSKANKDPDNYSGKGMALGGLIISYIMLFISLAMIIGITYLFNNYPEFKDAFMQGMQQGMPNPK